MPDSPFWTYKTLSEMSFDEWESLCDGCGKCCVMKLEDVDTGMIYPTTIGCTLLNCQTARCRHYETRQKHVPDCITLTPDNLDSLPWMPRSCAFRCINEGRPLPDWHPLISGTPQSVIDSGHSMAGKLIEADAIAEDDMPNYIEEWISLAYKA